MGVVLIGVLAFPVGACDGGGGPSGDSVVVRIPPGSSLADVADTLAANQIVESADRFTLFVRLRGDAGSLQAGVYAFRPGTEWSQIAADLMAGRVFTERLTIPEGFTLKRIATRIAEFTELDPEAVAEALQRGDAVDRWSVPGPTLEGYLLPETYTLTPGIELDEIIGAMVRQYRAHWTPERRERLDSLGLTEGELVTLASIVQAEARAPEELPIIASVYHNRLRIGMPLQADPTVLYALGGPRERLLYAAMDSVADSPYNTYTHPGLPPGPIGSPGAAAIDATLDPADTDLLYFVARPDGTHEFSRTLTEHNRARLESDRLWAEVRAEASRRAAFVRDSVAKEAVDDSIAAALALDSAAAAARRDSLGGRDTLGGLDTLGLNDPVRPRAPR